MKRNRLLSSSPKGRLFTSSTQPVHSKRHHIFALSLVSIVGIFVTTMVLATSEPVPGDARQVIELPSLGEAHDGLALPASSGKRSAVQSDVVAAQHPHKPSVEHIPAAQVPDSPAAAPEVVESAEIEKLHLQQEGAAAVTTDTHETAAPKAQAAVESDLRWQDYTVKQGDNLSLIFPRVGLSARDVYNVAQSGDDIKPLLNLKPGQILRFGLSTDTEESTVLRQLQLQLSPVETLLLTATDTGYAISSETREVEKRQQQLAGQIESSLFEAGLKAGLSDKTIMELAHIFGWDIDFALDLRQGDSFKVIFEEAYVEGEKYNDGAILAAEFTNRGNTYRAVRYTDAEGVSHYFTPDGESMRKTFTRTPVHFSRISSKFNPNRLHPVLKTSRPHRGVDYAAPTGTPILATGDGKVDFVGTKGGYGQTVVLSHGGKYTTLYAHMSRFKKGLRAGQRVRQGDTIGYIGSSGLATGPHLHYEFRIDGVHRNPLTVELPKAQPLPAGQMADFKRSTQPLLAQLDQLELPALAMNRP